MKELFTKIVYITLTIFLGFLLSMIVHSILEIYLINLGCTVRVSSILGHSCYLPDYLNFIITVSGVVGGYFLGLYWYRKIYEKK